MKRLLYILLLALLPSVQAAPDLQTVLANMDRASAGFKGMRADVEWVKYTAIVDDKSVEKGVIVVRRESDKSASVMIEFQDPYPYFFSLRGAKVEIYRPKIAQVEEYDLSSSRGMLEQALLVGFGASGKFLSEHYNVELKGEETAAGQPTVKLELIPKSEEMLKRVPRLEMWISTKNWQAVQQKLYQPHSEDHRLYTYTNITLNPPQKDSDFRLKIPRGVKRVYPQK